ncbi:MAG TPA: winged helix-turn-helix transcriptional regulator [Oligella sp.]|nr:winged helix-turn-helix transcriptional regulator [Oligella sp.]
MLTERQQAVLSLLESDPTISRQAIVASLGINASAVQKHLVKLKELGIIERVGGTRGYWQVNL